MTLSPAYGRDYKSKAEVLKDWEAGKDFTVEGLFGYGYINKADALRTGLKTVNIRYKQLRSVVVVKVEA